MTALEKGTNNQKQNRMGRAHGQPPISSFVNKVGAQWSVQGIDWHFEKKDKETCTYGCNYSLVSVSSKFNPILYYPFPFITNMTPYLAPSERRTPRFPSTVNQYPFSLSPSKSWHLLCQNLIKSYPTNRSTGHGGANIPFKHIAIGSKIFGRFLIQGIRGIRFEEEELSINKHWPKKKKKKKKKKPYLHADNNGIQIQHRLPILAQNIQTHISFHVDIRMVNLLRALDLWRIVGEVLIDREGEVESAALVHAFVGFDGEGKV